MLDIIDRVLESERKSQLVWLRGRIKPIRIRHLEYRLLCLLAESPDKPISDVTLFNALYGSQKRCDDLLKVTVNTLRKKLKDNGTRIQRVYLFGYKIPGKYLRKP